MLVVGDSLTCDSMTNNLADHGTEMTNWTQPVFGPAWLRDGVVNC